MPHREGKHEEKYILAYIFTKEQWKIKIKAVRIATYTGRESINGS